jgi:hypothetical protein
MMLPAKSMLLLPQAQVALLEALATLICLLASVRNWG